MTSPDVPTRDARQSSRLVRLLSPLRDFLETEASGAILLASAAVAAIVWANSPWNGSYEALWSSHAGVTVAGHTLELDVREWINDGLMTIFFLVVGLEIKRELTHGHLSSRRAALLPAAAALGGMLAPALIYLAIAGGSAPRGWAIPVATDIALAVGVLAVAGDRIPTSLRAFLLGLAIVDDIGAIIIIAIAYSTGVVWMWLFTASAGLLVTALVRRLHVHATWVYVVIGCGIWFSLHEAGIHPTLAGVALGLLAPSTPRVAAELIDSDELIDLTDVDHARASSEIARHSVSVVEWLQHILHPWTSYVIVPVFALANAGIEISSDGIGEAARSPITWGVLLGLLAGKPLGVIVATRAAVRAGLADDPNGSTRQGVVGIAMAAGIGFTVALFVTELAFDDPVDRSNAKLAILLASVLAAIVSIVILTRRPARLPLPRRGTANG